MAIIEADVLDFSIHEECGCPNFSLDTGILNGLIDFKRKNDPRFRGLTDAELAELCGVSETTYKSLKSGRNKKPRIDILHAVVYTFGGSIDRMVGLAPPRDFAHESAVYDATLMDTMRSRVQELEQASIGYERELAQLRRTVQIKGEAASAAEARAVAAESRVSQLERDLSAHESHSDACRTRAENLHADLKASESTNRAHERTIVNLERMYERQKRINQGLLVAACSFALLSVAVAAVLVR